MMTYKELKEILSTLTEEQLNFQIMCSASDSSIGSGKISEVWIAEEDQINPSGEYMEPVSIYLNDPDIDVELEPIVCKQGTPILILT